jgi:hypothetical protein
MYPLAPAQGMTVDALQAQALRQCLQHGASGLARRFFRAAAEPITVAWQLAAGGDLNLPDIKGPRPLSVRIVNRLGIAHEKMTARPRFCGRPR